jgi:hypothetical protein
MEMIRRDFLWKSTLGLAAASQLEFASAHPAREEAQTTTYPGGGLDLDHLLDKNAIRPRGQYYEARVPDTLDLAERARLAVNGMTGLMYPDKFYYTPENVVFKEHVDPQPLTWNLVCEYLFSLPLSRTMSGSTQNQDLEYGAMRTYLAGMGKDGIIRSPMDDRGKPKGSAFPDNSGFLGMAILNWYQRDGQRAWLEALELLTKGFQKMAIRVADRAYFPPECCYMPDGTWYREGRGTPLIPYEIPTEPTLDSQGYEGAVKYYQSSPLQAALALYRYTGNTEALALAKGISRFLLKPSLWSETARLGYPEGAAVGVWDGHFHGALIPLWALLNVALIEGDDELKAVVRRGYDEAIRCTVQGVGWSPLWHPVGALGRPPQCSYFCDNCQTVDTVVLAIKMSDAGMGDYWDDVDSIVRNEMIENQFADPDKFQRVFGYNAQNAAMMKRFVGGFFQTELTRNQYPFSNGYPQLSGCCCGSGPWGLYYAWHGITRFDDGVATVNLFLNRASPWMDVDSYLPHEGRVVLHNKQAHTALVRIPGWINLRDLKCQVNRQRVQPPVLGRRVLFSGLKSGDQITLEFPVEERAEKRTVYGKEYKVIFRGTTVVDISPREPGKVLLYERASLRSAKTPTRIVQRFIPDKLIPLV